MKKILILLGVVSLNITSVSTIISCDNAGGISYEEISDNINLLEVGKDIDKSNAKDTSVSNLQFSNFFVLGDSLVDSGGLTKMTGIRVGTDQKNRTNYQNNSFTNGEVASIVLNNKLQFSQLKPADQNNFPDEWNRNFAISGATASEYNSMAASMIHNNVSIRKQTGRLISQNIINSNDLILISIGGNDLRNIISLVNNYNERVKALNKIIKDIVK